MEKKEEVEMMDEEVRVESVFKQKTQIFDYIDTTVWLYPSSGRVEISLWIWGRGEEFEIKGLEELDEFKIETGS